MIRGFSRFSALVASAVVFSALVLQVSATPNQPLLPGSHKASEITEFYPSAFGPYNSRTKICDLDPAACDTTTNNMRPNFWVKIPQVDFGSTGVNFRDKAFIWSAVPWGDAGRMFKIVIDSSTDSATMFRNTVATILISWSQGGWDGIDVDSALVTWNKDNNQGAVTGKHDVFIWAFDPNGNTTGGVGNFYAFAFRPGIPNEAGINVKGGRVNQNAANGFLVKNCGTQLSLSLPSINNWKVSVISASGAIVTNATLNGSNSATIATSSLISGSYIVRAVSNGISFSQRFIVSK